MPMLLKSYSSQFSINTTSTQKETSVNSRWRIRRRPGIQKAPLHEKMHRERERIYLELIRFTPFAQKHPPLMLFPTVRSAKGKGKKDYSPVLFISSAKEGEKMKGFFSLPSFGTFFQSLCLPTKRKSSQWFALLHRGRLISPE